MDTKVIAMVGAVIVVGAAVYGVATGTVLPGTEDIEEEPASPEEGTPSPTTSPDESEDEVTEDSGENETVVGNETEEITDTEPLPIICEEQGGNIGRDDVNSVTSAAETLDPLRVENMIHNALNEVRALRSDAELFKCDPGLREIARDHSQLILIQDGARGGNYITSDYEGTQEMIRELGGDLEIQENIADITADDVEVNETRMFDGACGEDDDYVLEHGKFAYGVNIEGGSSGDYSFSGGSAADFAEDQDITIIRDHEDLTREARRNFVNDNLDTITDRSKARQGIGVAIDRRTAEVVVTMIVCGPRPDPTQEQNP